MADTDQQLIEGQLMTEAAREELVTEEVLEEEQAQEFEEAQEIDRMNQLDAARQEEASSIQQLATRLLQQGMAFSSPSMFKWGILLSLALVNDVVDILDVTGIGAVLSWVISMALTSIILLIIWFTDGGMKAAQEYASSVGDAAQQAQIASRVHQIGIEVQSMAEKTAGALKRVPGFKNIKVRSTPRKNPLARALLGSAIESIPFLGAINLITVWVFLAYLAEKHAYKSARASAEDTYTQLSSQATEMV
ncbi:MAG: hypothetical protein Q8R55_07975 [Candidatus Taylorbacteria bacterium]|nr:hypothetical protein [Candidatus Taylorbacteria bacterium]